MISSDLFRDHPVLVGARVRLEPLGGEHFEGMSKVLASPEVARLTGTQKQHSPELLRQWLATRKDQHDRADWAVLVDGVVVGEVVLNDLDTANAGVNFRIALHVFGHGYGTEATRLVVDYAFKAGLHRIELEVFSFNPRAVRVYEKCGFVREGVRRQVLRWDGEWHDAITMSILATDARP